MNRIVLAATLTVVSAPLAMRGADFLENPNRFSLGARFGMNFKASFRKNPTPALTLSPGPATGGADHFYDDGSVRPDSSGTASGLTWNWGYQNASQVVGDTMQFHSSQPNPAFSSTRNATDDPQLGLELIYQRAIGTFSSSGRWGIEAGFGYTDLDLRANSRGPGRSIVTTDAFALNGVAPPAPGYNGTFAGPGALLGDTPSRTITPETLASGEKLSGQLFSIRLGPFAEWDLTQKLSLGASVGITLAPASVDYDFTETVSGAGGLTSITRGHSSKAELLYGPYVSGALRYEFTDRFGAYIGAQFQSLGDLDQSVAGRSARLDQGATIYGTVGISYRF
jgi:hypothetical protein